MEFDSIWKAVLIIVAGIVLLHISGRKSISQMTIGQTVLMIAVGTLLIQPVASKNLWQTLFLSLILVLTLFIFELLALKWNFFEGILRGRSKVVIENGILKISTMKKLRLTVDELEMHLRQSGIERIDDVKWATIEMSGQLGYVLIDRKKYATKEDIARLQLMLEDMSKQLELTIPSTFKTTPIIENSNLFTEIENPTSVPKPLE
ncbi:DUF421 domain-containing protein [Sporosarcina sp. P21c]|uniref:DUF421 domain-containing protein n=1 Tax=Sporosarcina TaxID=1569 RepID=UPI000A16554C|nr:MULTISPECIES: YetF domain-containing protein [Sporosarcina]ARJ38896.1 hypothetical protein SporoP8_08445 [Sporosarcina ureae]PIC68266.1 DUF421 domain-containing protein [Sporosarcina sp. P16a]PIC84090.1 DUF421 domain-containing protein [Sporosarcina sp. P1]PIC90476.1 DUF421 domain-containing protein [Sporosarcina sp. P21c]PIC94007.1 DUF421 domain-containing protein [Sporosarcina sp. P25]